MHPVKNFSKTGPKNLFCAPDDDLLVAADELLWEEGVDIPQFFSKLLLCTGRIPQNQDITGMYDFKAQLQGTGSRSGGINQKV